MACNTSIALTVTAAKMSGFQDVISAFLACSNPLQRPRELSGSGHLQSGCGFQLDVPRTLLACSKSFSTSS